MAEGGQRPFLDNALVEDQESQAEAGSRVSVGAGNQVSVEAGNRGSVEVGNRGSVEAGNQGFVGVGNQGLEVESLGSEGEILRLRWEIQESVEGSQGFGEGTREWMAGLVRVQAVGVPTVSFVWEYECSSSAHLTDLDAPSSLGGVRVVHWALPQVEG